MAVVLNTDEATFNRLVMGSSNPPSSSPSVDPVSLDTIHQDLEKLNKTVDKMITAVKTMSKVNADLITAVENMSKGNARSVMQEVTCGVTICTAIL
jgi:hypothetical protein